MALLRRRASDLTEMERDQMDLAKARARQEAIALRMVDAGIPLEVIDEDVSKEEMKRRLELIDYQLRIRSY